jgi:Mor family transcriptional regulator
MASEFVADSAERIVTIARALGVSTEVAGKIANEWQAGVIADWGGERAYVGKSRDAQRDASRRHAALMRDWRAGERVPALARKYGMNERTVRKIIARSGPAMP